jgi:hypothetical protein
LQDIVDALYPEGYDVEIRPKAGLRLDAAQLRCKIKFAAAAAGAKANPKLLRELMRDLGRLGGKARQAKYQSLSPEERKAIVDKARKTKRENRLIRTQLSAQRPPNRLASTALGRALVSDSMPREAAE